MARPSLRMTCSPRRTWQQPAYSAARGTPCGSGSTERTRVAEPYPTCWLNGTFRPLIDARISPLDRGFLFGDGVYEVVPVHRGRPFRLRQHLERLERSLAEVRIRNPLAREGWVDVTNRLVAA